MTTSGEYVPSPRKGSRDQVSEIERTGTTDSVDIMGLPVVLLTMVGAKTGAIRKVPLMRVEHAGLYAAVASMGGSPEHPQWYWNLRQHPELDLQDGTVVTRRRARELEGAERDAWWERCVAAFPPYAGYQRKTERLIPLFVLEPV
ncbi:deazaflavin-dependent oxidoreductase (nitroreductase family) [Humibacillus xanthopallidus]|uniref:Deazaflavin-dependent oxidoreductase (Nitroreductase family) n=1 Tax=Humibacillus xanthopallidus TaxID=412689 RepID=A0A543PX45_9MICO|nr:nitroreductase family deazaflavin-dependent oxidoreductase [Humibacillus xanthopallidus]TQN48636.1 deazaflavin-dependent oxidoreductase (nitroreductase family) [Humibacillus xanthopallidus]